MNLALRGAELSCALCAVEDNYLLARATRPAGMPDRQPGGTVTSYRNV